MGLKQAPGWEVENIGFRACKILKACLYSPPLRRYTTFFRVHAAEYLNACVHDMDTASRITMTEVRVVRFYLEESHSGAHSFPDPSAVLLYFTLDMLEIKITISKQEEQKKGKERRFTIFPSTLSNRGGIQKFLNATYLRI